jgi:hypothetical protein
MSIRTVRPSDAVLSAYDTQRPEFDLPRAPGPTPAGTLPQDLPPWVEVFGIEPPQLADHKPPEHRSWRFPSAADGRVTVGEVRGTPPVLAQISYGSPVHKAAQIVSDVFPDYQNSATSYELRILTSSQLLSEAYWFFAGGDGANDIVVPFNTALRGITEGVAMPLSDYLKKLQAAAKTSVPNPARP